jgi:hypothetical protein
MKIVRKKTANTELAQELQDRIFRKMPIQKKLEMLDGFFRFAKELNSFGKKYGSGRIAQKSRKNA